MSKKTYITTARIEERDKAGKKTFIPANKQLELTAAEAKKYGKAVKEVETEEADELDDGTGDDDSGGDNGGGGTE